MNDIERAEFIQSLNAYLIPTSLFIACLCGAAGIFLIREGEGLGWGFVAASALIIAWAFYAFVSFQNKLRHQGKFVDEDRPSKTAALGTSDAVPNSAASPALASVPQTLADTALPVNELLDHGSEIAEQKEPARVQ